MNVSQWTHLLLTIGVVDVAAKHLGVVALAPIDHLAYLIKTRRLSKPQNVCLIKLYRAGAEQLKQRLK